MKKNCKYCGRTIHGYDDFCCEPCRDKYNERYAPHSIGWKKVISALFWSALFGLAILFLASLLDSYVAIFVGLAFDAYACPKIFETILDEQR